MQKTADIAVVGLGAHGTAALYQAAKRGARVIGFERKWPAHEGGSSHGESRITRLATGEGHDYYHFAKRSLQIWRELEETCELKTPLYLRTGGLVIGQENDQSLFHGRSDFVSNTIDVAQLHGIEHEIMGAHDIRERFPEFNVRDGEFGYYEKTAGIVFPDKCIAMQSLEARRLGATEYCGADVYRIRQKNGDVQLTTSHGTFSVGQCIVAAGAWVKNFLPAEYHRYFKVHRQLLYWFDAARQTQFDPSNFPVFIWGRHQIYGFPSLGGLVKIGTGVHGEESNPDHVNRIVWAEEREAMKQTVIQALPSLSSKIMRSMTCLYTVTPDNDFVIDRHPEMDRVLIVSACSGHGFKHSAAVGEYAARIVSNEPMHELNRFALSRFSQ